MAAARQRRRSMSIRTQHMTSWQGAGVLRRLPCSLNPNGACGRLRGRVRGEEEEEEEVVEEEEEEE